MLNARRRGIAARLWAVTTIPWILGLVPAGMAGGVPPSAAPHRVSVAEAISTGDADARALRSAAGSEGLASLLQVALASQGFPVPEAADLTAPATVQDAIGLLHRRVTDALEVIGPLSRGAFLRRMNESTAGTTMTRTRKAERFLSVPGKSPPRDTWQTATPHPDLPIEAASMIADAIDTALPILMASSRSRAVTERSADGCDVLDARPGLCVASEANNRHEDNAALLIDLGGDDTYVNAAGGAPFQSSNPSVLSPVSVNIDLSGDDAYVPARDPAELGPSTVVAAGAALSGAVGIAVDVEGDDEYAASLAAPPLEAIDGRAVSRTFVQGAAHQGIGLLVDGGGNDRYAVVRDALDPQAPAGLREERTVSAQGGSVVGIGVLVDRGGEDDYSIDAGLVEHLADDGSTFGFNGGPIIYGQGGGVTGLGALIDLGPERNGFEVASETRPPVGNVSIAVATPKAFDVVQGAGSYGAGLLLTGTGPTRYRVETLHHGMGGRDWVFAQGAGTATGRGVLEDLGGDDSFEVSVSAHEDRTLELPCAGGCSGTDHTLTAYTEAINVTAQGAAGEAAVGLLRDHGGNDSYLVQTDHELHVTLRDHRMDGPPSSLAVGGYTMSLHAQGAGAFFTEIGGTGVLSDDGGSDRYEVAVRSRTSSSASRTSPGPAPTAIAIGLNPALWAQGSTTKVGEAALIDKGGQGDSFLVRLDQEVTAAPREDLAFRDATSWPQVQGAGQGTFVALGQAPLIQSLPGLPACSSDGTATRAAVRGVGLWQNCPSDSSLDSDSPTPNREPIGAVTYGAATNAPHGGGQAQQAATSRFAPRLTLPAGQGDRPLPRSATTDATKSSIPVEANLADTSGQPLGGIPVDFVLQFRCAISACFITTWLNMWQSSARTSGDGVATTRLQTYALDQIAQRYPATEFRILATASSSSERLPAFAAVPLLLEDG